MIRFRCDKCEELLEVQDELAGRKVKCPHCGDINIARADVPIPAQASQASAQPPVDRAAAAGKPPARGPEVEVLALRPAVLRARPLTALMLFIVLIGGLFGGFWFAFMRPIPAASIVCFAFAAVAGIAVMIWKLHKLGSRLSITTKRTIERKGFFSKSTTEVLHADIRNFQVTQSFWQRLWGVGTIGISSAADDDVEIVMHDVARPDDVRQLIDLYRPL